MRYVYFAEAETAAGIRAVKIGVAQNPHQRVRDLQCGNPVRIKLRAFVPGGPDLERRLHLTFDMVGLCGEWFARTGKLDLLLRRLESGAAQNDQRGMVSFAQFETAIADSAAAQDDDTADFSYWAEYA